MQPSLIQQYPAAPSADAVRHFAAKLSVETDCSDVYAALQDVAAGRCQRDFVLLDVRSAAAYAKRHAAGAVSLPHRHISDEILAAFGRGLTFVVYCAGPHCNGADQAAWKIARLGYPVKLMSGGITGWADEGLPFAGLLDDTATPIGADSGADPSSHTSSNVDATHVRCDCA